MDEDDDEDDNEGDADAVIGVDESSCDSADDRVGRSRHKFPLLSDVVAAVASSCSEPPLWWPTADACCNRRARALPAAAGHA